MCVCERLRDAVWLKSLSLSIIRFSAADATLAHLRTRALTWHTRTLRSTQLRLQEKPQESHQRSTEGHWKSCRGQRSWQLRLKVRGGIRAIIAESWASGLYWRDCWRLRCSSTLLWSAGKSCSARHTHTHTHTHTSQKDCTLIKLYIWRFNLITLVNALGQSRWMLSYRYLHFL